MRSATCRTGLGRTTWRPTTSRRSGTGTTPMRSPPRCTRALNHKEDINVSASTLRRNGSSGSRTSSRRSTTSARAAKAARAARAARGTAAKDMEEAAKDMARKAVRSRARAGTTGSRRTPKMSYAFGATSRAISGKTARSWPRTRSSATPRGLPRATTRFMLTREPVRGKVRVEVQVHWTTTTRRRSLA